MRLYIYNLIQLKTYRRIYIYIYIYIAVGLVNVSAKLEGRPSNSLCHVSSEHLKESHVNIEALSDPLCRLLLRIE
jgi:hypothetical protein